MGKFNLLPQDTTPALFQNLTLSGNVRAMRLPGDAPAKTEALNGASPAGFESFDIDEQEDNPDTEPVFLNNPNIFEEHSSFLGIGSKRKAKKRLARFDRKQKRKDNNVARKISLMQARNVKTAEQPTSAWAQENEVSGEMPAIMQNDAPSGFQQFDSSFNLGESRPPAGFDEYGNGDNSFSYEGDGIESFLGMGKDARARRTDRRKENQAAKKYKFETDRIRAKQGIPKDSIGSSIAKIGGSIAGIVTGKKAADDSGDYNQNAPQDYRQDSPKPEPKINKTMIYALAAALVIGLVVYLKSKK